MSTTRPNPPPVLLLDRAGAGARTTPGRLRVALVGIWLAALLFFLAGRAGVNDHRRGVQTVGRDTAPSIIAAERVRAELAGMHAAVGREFLLPSDRQGAAAAEFDAGRRAVTEGLMAAAGNITFGDAERVPIRTVLEGLGPYEGAISQARLLNARGGTGFVEPLRRADALLTETLLPAADALDRANREALDAGYDRARRAEAWALVRLVIGGLVLLGVLVATQAFLSRRTRRRINPALAAATALALVLLGGLVAAYAAAGRELQRAKADCFESIHVLERARADGLEMLAAQRLALLDPARSEVYAKRIRDRRTRMITPAPGTTLDALAAEVAAQAQPPDAGRGGDEEAVPRAWGAFARTNLPPAVTGHLAVELRNITFVGEREAAVETLRGFAAFAAADASVAELAAAGKRADAVGVALSDQPGGSAGAFRGFDAALGRTLDINHREFARAVDRGSAGLGAFEWATPLAALTVALLASAGLRPRLKEYAP